jgi:PBP1b-binding outer membrane lipoprotein LpoB
MKYIILPLAIALVITSCSSSKKTTAAAEKNPAAATVAATNTATDGSSFEKAIVINSGSETAGVNAEYAWLKKNYPGYKTKSQRLVYHDKKPYDVITIETADGNSVDVYFDISKFFGKL